jgi:hypothetical protein
MDSFKVDIFHNVTTTGEAAAKGDEDCARLVKADAGYAECSAPFSRLGGPKARPGDRLRKVVTLTLETDARTAGAPLRPPSWLATPPTATRASEYRAARSAH